VYKSYDFTNKSRMRLEYIELDRRPEVPNNSIVARVFGVCTRVFSAPKDEDFGRSDKLLINEDM
jgi:hypothetical protein